MNFNGANEFSHFAIHVSNLERSLEFYADRLGLEVLTEFVEEGETTRDAVGYPEAVLNLAMLRLPGTRALMEVIEYRKPAGTPVDPEPANPGTCHICFYVDDLVAAWADLEAAGIEPVSEGVIDVPEGPMKGGKTIYCKDPDGIRIQFREANTTLESTPRDPAQRGHTAPANEFSHLGVHVRNLERSLEFYRDQLGLEVVAEQLIQADYLRQVVDHPEADINMATLRLPGSLSGTQSYLEVSEYQNVSGTPIDTEHANPGTCHMAFYVDDLDTTWAKLKAFGSEMVSTRVVELRDGPLAGGKVIYIKDPDGIRVELLQARISLTEAVEAGEASETDDAPVVVDSSST
jgi:catechol 2,3-dioxygenase-like lactoylglutathione lyase family enzyme